jgi:hypothetical protein
LLLSATTNNSTEKNNSEIGLKRLCKPKVLTAASVKMAEKDVLFMPRVDHHLYDNAAHILRFSCEQSAYNVTRCLHTNAVASVSTSLTLNYVMLLEFVAGLIPQLIQQCKIFCLLTCVVLGGIIVIMTATGPKVHGRVGLVLWAIKSVARLPSEGRLSTSCRNILWHVKEP